MAEKQNGSSVKQEKWVYSWNPSDQMTKAEKFTGTSDTYAGKIEYEYCLSCDGALSVRREYGAGSSSVPVSRRRYEYDGLNLLRVDEKYDISGGSLDADDPWRTLEVSTHRPGALGALLSKRVFTHTDNNDTADATNDYVYVYDPVGNVWVILASDGHELYHFTQDAFGNELSIAPFNGTSWQTARNAGITEQQTGKWMDPFTGLYYFHARWMDAGVGRFVGRNPLRNNSVSTKAVFSRSCRRCTSNSVSLDSSNMMSGTYSAEETYLFCRNSPLTAFDPDGREPFVIIIGGTFVVIDLVGSGLFGLYCESLIKSLRDCLQWELQRPLTKEELKYLTGEVLNNNHICWCSFMAVWMMDHIKPTSPPQLQPTSCTKKLADAIIDSIGFPRKTQ